MYRTLFLYTLFCLTGAFTLAQVPRQNIRGVVMDADSRERLLGASIVLINENRGTISDPQGCFVFEDMEVGRYTLQASFVGYKPVVYPELLLGSGKELNLEIMLETSISELDEVIIRPNIRKDKAQNSMAIVCARSLSVEEANRYAGAIDDPGRMAGNFAGVTSVGAHLNAIVVRGNAPKGLLWRLEGMDIPVPSHFAGSNVAGGGSLTMFSGQILANSDFYTGAFAAEYGNTTAGVFDMQLRNGNSYQAEYAVQIGLQGIEAAAEGPLGRGSAASYLVNYRYSTMALIFPLLPEIREDNEIPVYQDLSFKLHLPAGKAGTFSVWGLGGLSHTRMEGYKDPEQWEYPENRVNMDFHYNMGAMGFSHSKSLSSRTYIQTRLGYNASGHLYDKKSRLDYSRPDQLFPLFKVSSISGQAALSTKITHVLSPRLTIMTGVDINRYLYELSGRSRDHETGAFLPSMEGLDHASLLEGYFQAKYMLHKQVFMVAGMNASWFELNQRSRLEPRLSASWNPHPNHRLTVGYGIHSQTEPLFVYFVRREDPLSGELTHPNRDLKRMAAQHFVLGYDWSPAPDLRLKIEPYVQYLSEVPVVSETAYSMVNFMSDWTFNRVLTNQGTGINKGIDLTIERFLQKGMYFMTTASLYKSEYTGGDGDLYRTRFDGGYVINLLSGKEYLLKGKNLLGFNVKFTLMGPYWHHPVDLAATELASEIIYAEDQPLSYRYSSLESITDFSIQYRINSGRVSSVLTLQVRNLLGKQYLGKRFNLEKRIIENHLFTSPVPFLSYKLEF